MNDESAFLEAIAKTPDDDALRLVYADWLEERGDPRAEYLRLEVQLANVTPGAKDDTLEHATYHRLTDRLSELRPRLDSLWVDAAGRRYDVILLPAKDHARRGIVKIV